MVWLRLRKLFAINRGRTSVAICYAEWLQILADCATEVAKKRLILHSIKHSFLIKVTKILLILVRKALKNTKMLLLLKESKQFNHH